MFSIIKRILRLSGKYRPRVIAGLIFNALKSCCAAFVFFAVLLVMLNIEHLTETVILQAFGIVALSVLGRFLFQYLSDVLMSASGYEIFREKRLEIGNQLKRAPMGYFTENNLGTVQTVLTTTISDLEGNCMLALTFLVGGFVQALAMTLMLGIFCWQIGFLALTGILAGILVLGRRAYGRYAKCSGIVGGKCIRIHKRHFCSAHIRKRQRRKRKSGSSL